MDITRYQWKTTAEWWASSNAWLKRIRSCIQAKPEIMFCSSLTNSNINEGLLQNDKSPPTLGSKQSAALWSHKPTQSYWTNCSVPMNNRYRSMMKKSFSFLEFEVHVDQFDWNCVRICGESMMLVSFIKQ